MKTPRIEEMVEEYAESYKGILPPEAIERSKDYWRNQLQQAYERGRKEGRDEARKSLDRYYNESDNKNCYGDWCDGFLEAREVLTKLQDNK